MKVYVLTFEDGGDNEIFAGVVSDIKKIKNPEHYHIYYVEIDSPFSATTNPWEFPMQFYKEIK